MHRDQIINVFPYINPFDFFRTNKSRDPILDLPNCYLYSSGRSALYHGFLTLDVSLKNQILMPSFHCGVEVEAAVRAGCQVEFYNIKTDLQVDLYDLRKKINSKSLALCIIHYFGFPQPMQEIRQLCKENNLILIEDCAHALYSEYENEFVGTFGELAAFSLQKTVALPNGGALLINSKEIPNPKIGKEYVDFTLVKSTIKSILEFVACQKGVEKRCALFFLTMYEALTIEKMTESGHSDSKEIRWYYNVPCYDYLHNICFLSKPLMHNLPYDQIVKRRRQNYQLLADMLSDLGTVQIFSSNISSGLCPLCFPVFVEKRDWVVNKLRELGIEPFVFGKLSHPLMQAKNFPDLSFLSDSLLGLPVHQKLKEKELSIIVSALHQIY